MAIVPEPHPISDKTGGAPGLCEGIHQLLFGYLSPEYLLPVYPGWRKLLRLQVLAPPVPGRYSFPDYIHSIIPKLVQSVEEDESGMLLLQPFYRFEDKNLRSFHPLCDFYRLICCYEMRMLIRSVERWRDTLPRQYFLQETGELISHLASYLERCEHLLAKQKPGFRGVKLKLWYYLCRVLKFELAVILMEITERFKYFGHANSLGSREVYTYLLHQPVPDPLPLYPTRYRFYYHLQFINTRLNISSQVLQKAIGASYPPPYISKACRQEQEFIRDTIENIYCYYRVMEELHPTPLTEADLSRLPLWYEGRISGWIKELKNGNNALLIKALSQCEEDLCKNIDIREKRDAASAACRLTLLYSNLGSAGSESIHAYSSLVEEPDTSYTYKDKEQPEPFSGLVSLDDVMKQLHISRVTLNKYLRQSGIPEVRFSAKSRWLRSSDCKKFLDYFTRTMKSRAREKVKL